MHFVDYTLFAIYFFIVLGIGFYFYRKNTSKEDYYVGNRNIPPSHVGMSIVATDVGGGFSIGLGGLGFTMGLAGSWLLFTGLVGAWLAAIFIIPRIKKIDAKLGMMTYPDFLRYRFGKKVALAAAVISGIGYLGFTGGQVLAGAKLAAGTVFSDVSILNPLTFSLLVMAGIIIIYTVLGGLKAVIFTDTIQWTLLLGGLFIFGVPFTYIKIGGWEALQSNLPAEFLTLTNVKITTLVNWAFTIIPIWFIAMTLYQRIFACKDEKDAKRAFYVAGVLEYPIMAFLGVALGMMGRIVFPGADSEMAMPMLLKNVLPIGVTGIVISAYFSAIMSTADSCLIASSGNWVNDVIERYFIKNTTKKQSIKISQIVTLIIGVLAVLIASSFENVLDIILQAYAFMVAGLFIPTIGAYFWKKSTSAAALISMFGGGGLTLTLIFLDKLFVKDIFIYLFGKNSPILELDPAVFGILFSFVLFVMISLMTGKKNSNMSQ